MRPGLPAKRWDTRSITPGVSILHFVNIVAFIRLLSHLRSALEVLHYVQETVVNIWMVGKLDLDLV